MSNQYSDHDCAFALQVAANVYQKSPTRPEYNALGWSPTGHTIERRLGDGSWNDAKEAAGLSRTSHYRKGVDEEFFTNPGHPKVAYWIGFLLGDGYIYEKDGYYGVTLGLQLDDKSHVDQFKSDVGAEHSVTVHQRETESASIGIQNTEFVSPLVDLGVTPDKTHDSSVPNVPDDALPHMVRGWFDADGSFANRRAQLTAANNERLRTLADRLPVSSTVKQIPDENYSNLYVFGEDNLLDLIKWLYPEGESTRPALSRKAEQACNIYRNEH